MHFWVDDLGREELREIGDAFGGCAAHAPYGTAARNLHAERHRAHFRGGLPTHEKPILAVGDQRFAPTCAKGTPATQEERRLQQAGLAGGIRPDKKIGGGVELQLDRSEAAEALGAKTAEGHPAP